MIYEPLLTPLIVVRDNHLAAAVPEREGELSSSEGSLRGNTAYKMQTNILLSQKPTPFRKTTLNQSPYRKLNKSYSPFSKTKLKIIEQLRADMAAKGMVSPSRLPAATPLSGCGSKVAYRFTMTNFPFMSILILFDLAPDSDSIFLDAGFNFSSIPRA